MRVVRVPGRLVRHPVTNRIIDDRGVQVDPDDLAFATLIAAGDLVVEPEEAPGEPGAPASPAGQE